uniref:PIN domain-containing protein n=1 Tax=Rhodopseudomonas palustris (strain BisA53) TaxID=316055 RepID=Q07Q00_RHOP5
MVGLGAAATIAVWSVAGQTFREYRRSGGIRTSILADFFIGAHAAAVRIPILTRDTARYRNHFPDVELIAPG